METSLHRALKGQYGTATGGKLEVSLLGYRIDAVEGDGTLVEVQSGALGPLRGKLARLLPEARVRVVKPVILARKVVRRAKKDSTDLSSRFSPKRGSLFDVFDDLIGVARVFPHENMQIDILGVEVDEIRVSRRRWPGYSVADRVLRQILASVTLRTASDLWTLLPGTLSTGPFTTRELAEALDRPLHIAQRVAYCLRHTGAVDELGKSGNRRVYVRAAVEETQGRQRSRVS